MTGLAAVCLAALDLNLQLMKLLAVAGGAAVGYLVLGGVLRFLGRFVFRSKLPRLVHVGVRLLGGVACGLLVWLWLFGAGGPGGWGSGGGGWLPFGGSGPAGDGAARPADPSAKPPEPPPPRDETLQVEMLGGTSVKEQRFYRVEGAAQSMTFSELTRFIVDRRQKSPEMNTLRILVKSDSVAANHPAVTQLDKWARDNGMTPELAKP